MANLLVDGSGDPVAPGDADDGNGLQTKIDLFRSNRPFLA
jgi:hypothetical protein